MALARERRRVPRRDDRAAAARRAGQGAEADDRARAGADPDLPRGDRAEQHARWPARSPTAGCRRSSPPSTCPSCAGSLEEGAARAGRSLDDFDIAPTVNVFIGDDIAAARDADAAVHRPVRRRHGLAGQELLQPARRALRVRGRRARDPGPLPRGHARTRRRPRSRTSSSTWSRSAAPRTACATGCARSPMRASGRSASRPWPGPGTSGCAAAAARADRGDDRLRVLLGAFGDAGHAFPMIALGRELRARGHDVVLETWTRWQADVERRGHAVRAGARSTTCSRRTSGR